MNKKTGTAKVSGGGYADLTQDIRARHEIKKYEAEFEHLVNKLEAESEEVKELKRDIYQRQLDSRLKRLEDMGISVKRLVLE